MPTPGPLVLKLPTEMLWGSWLHLPLPIAHSQLASPLGYRLRTPRKDSVSYIVLFSQDDVCHCQGQNEASSQHSKKLNLWVQFARELSSGMKAFHSVPDSWKYEKIVSHSCSCDAACLF